MLRPVYDATGGVDGRVSIEVDPRLAHDTAATIAEAKALWWLVDRPNLFIKIPATDAGLPAITEALAAGISVNVTLIFSLDRYREVMDAFLAGLEQARERGPTCPGSHSVASFFVSRVDTEVDKRLDKIGTDEAQGAARQGRRSPTPGSPTSPTRRSSPTARWQALGDAGAHAQRPLWASTGVKNPDYPDTHVRRGAGRARRGQHDAGDDPRRRRRPRRGHRRHRHAVLRRGRRACSTAWSGSASTTTT